MRQPRPLQLLAVLTSTALAWPLAASGSVTVQATLEARFAGDRTGVCVVAALVEPTQVQRGKTCAKPRADGGPGQHSVFEIGSISKTMTAFLVADLVLQGRWSLDDPLAKHLPEGTAMPRQGARQILLRDVLSHRSGLPGLPPGFQPRNPADPYAELSEQALLDALGQVRLDPQVAIGSRFEYSNFAMMLLSLAVARSQVGGDLERALTERLFMPLKMTGAHIARPRGAQPLAAGHLPSGQPTSAWHASDKLAGVGMVRASLDDMLAYTQAHLGQADAPTLARLRLTQQALSLDSAMAWRLFKHQGHELLAHEGGTGGFSAIVVIEPGAGRAVVVLADTSLSDLGGLGGLAQALLGLDHPPLRPRLSVPPSAELLAAVVGQFDLAGLRLRIWQDGPRLMAQAQGQPAFELKFDSEGDLYPEAFAALMTPQWRDGKITRALWRQGGGVLPMTRVED